MRLLMTMFTVVVLAGCFIPHDASESQAARIASGSFETGKPSKLQPNTLCATNERVIFSCPVQRPAKIVSVCASKDLTSEHGYLQYRFGLPGKLELEYPKDRTGTQEKFHYTHYFRAQFDLTEIGFTINGYEYSVFDDYNGEEKPAVSSQGVSVTAPGKPKEVSFVCRTKPRADFSDLQAVLSSGQSCLALTVRNKPLPDCPCGKLRDFLDVQRCGWYVEPAVEV